MSNIRGNFFFFCMVYLSIGDQWNLSTYHKGAYGDDKSRKG